MKKRALVLLSAAAMACTLSSCDVYGKKDFDKFQDKVKEIESVDYKKATIKIDYKDKDEEDLKLTFEKENGVWTCTNEGSALEKAAYFLAGNAYLQPLVGTLAVSEDEDTKYYTGLFGGFKVVSDDEKAVFNKYGYIVTLKDDEMSIKASFKK